MFQCFPSVQYSLDPNIIQYIFFYVPQKKESHTSMRLSKLWKMYHVWVNYPLDQNLWNIINKKCWNLFITLLYGECDHHFKLLDSTPFDILSLPGDSIPYVMWHSRRLCVPGPRHPGEQQRSPPSVLWLSLVPPVAPRGPAGKPFFSTCCL